MLHNHLKIAFRSLIKQKGYTLINLAGLSISLAIALLMLIWVQDEWQTDKFHTNGDRLYRLKRTIPLEANVLDVYNSVPYPVLTHAATEIPEVLQFIPLGRPTATIIVKEQLDIKAEGTFGNTAFFEAFSFPIVLGDISQLDKKPEAIAISESLAKSLFGNIWKTNAIGESIRLHNEGDFTVEAVYEDFPGRSSFQSDFIYNIQHFLTDNDWALEWTNSGMQGAVLLTEGADAESVRQKIEQMYQSHQTATLKEGCLLQPYAEQYLFGKFDEQAKVKGGRIEYVRIFGIAALFLLLIACINFVNLATARASKRAKEVGVRKTVGAGQRILIGQFMTEAGLITFIAIGLALLFAELLLPQARLMTEKQLYFQYNQPVFWMGMTGIFLFTSLLSGAYPAFVLAAFRPIQILKGKINEHSSKALFRKGLVVVQFVLALLLIVGSLVVQQQVHFIKNKNLGINKDNLIVIPKDENISEKYEVLRTELLAQEGIAKVTTAGPTPIDLQASTSGVSWPDKRADQENIEFQILWTESDFLDMFEIPLAAGNFYRAELLSDTTSIVFNEKAIEIMGLENPVGTVITWWGKPRQIIGVVKDFHNRSLHDRIEPTGILLDAEGTWSLFVKAEAGQIAPAIDGLEAVFAKVVPEVPLNYEFVDEQYQEFYKTEVLTGSLANYFAIISMFISCLGLFGLATFLAEQKTKEIGIRKVLGATLVNIVGLISKDFIRLVVIALLLAIPTAYLLMNHWLDDFAYHIEISWWVFLLAGLSALFFAFLTISFQSIRAALTNPVKSLRSE
ncbi:MAG TPA: ABC transporter permease [Saprospiraceae bacterium]|nr:ABC transporter permease [Saprospiraceae bacterium]HMQ82292.1 ABC transporter permease [Saprospiraceae bacterium]